MFIKSTSSGISGASVYLRGVSSSSFVSLTATINSSGVATFSNIQPGTYGVFTLSSGRGIVCQSTTSFTVSSSDVTHNLYSVLNSSYPRSYFTDPFTFSYNLASISQFQNYGWRQKSNSQGVSLQYHCGMDLARDSNGYTLESKNIVTVSSGFYLDRGTDANSERGYYIALRTGTIDNKEYSIMYQHLESLSPITSSTTGITKGQTVVGQVGKTGDDSGAHLHIEISTTRSFSDATKLLDPSCFFGGGYVS